MSWMHFEQAFAAKFPHFEPRLPQRALAQKVETCVKGGTHLLAQAPTGVGKSFGGSVPLIDYAVENNVTIVVATAMKSLQDQYFNKDLPHLAANYRPFRFAVIKGRSNYLCLAKTNSLKPGEISVDLDTLDKIIKDPATTGDIDQLTIEVTPADRSKLTTTSDECPGKRDCPFGAVCFAERAKEAAKAAHVVVTNHSLLVTDALIGQGSLLPPYERLLIDEGHELESYTTNTLSNEITSGGLLKLATDVAAFIEDRSYLVKAQEPIADLFQELGRRIDPKERTTPLNADVIAEVGAQIMACLDVVAGFATKVAGVTIHGDDSKSEKKQRLRKRVDSMRARLEGVIMADFADLVRWIEKNDRQGVILKFSPISVANFLRNNIWSRTPVTIMSATLAVGSDFSFLAERLGFDLNDTETFDCETPFDYKRQARTYIPRNVPDPSVNEGGHRAAVTMGMSELVKASDGRALLLFTSDKEMRFAYDYLRGVVEGMGHRALRQGQLPTRQLSEIFADDEHSVLFALKSFFTGIDVQGDSLRLLHINKLPFPNPSDVINKARCSLIDAKNGGKPWGSKGSFEKFTLPTMALDLLQAYGRLIRSVQDTGLVAISDPRLFSKKYGSTIINALPPAPLLDELDQATAFLRSLETVNA